ncbi:MAG: metallophosphoesterase [Myxococcales bacterium]|nr:metallophosphoesterase [Myxococcales bacterium]
MIEEDGPQRVVTSLDRVIDGLRLAAKFDLHVVSCASEARMQWARTRLLEEAGDAHLVLTEVEPWELGKGGPRKLVDRLLHHTARGILVLSASVMPSYVGEWALVFQRLNETRDQITRRFDGLVLLVLEPLKQVLAQNAADLWSVRSSSVVLEDEARPTEELVVERSRDGRAGLGAEEEEAEVGDEVAVARGMSDLDRTLEGVDDDLAAEDADEETWEPEGAPSVVSEPAREPLPVSRPEPEPEPTPTPRSIPELALGQRLAPPAASPTELHPITELEPFLLREQVPLAERSHRRADTSPPARPVAKTVATASMQAPEPSRPRPGNAGSLPAEAPAAPAPASVPSARPPSAPETTASFPGADAPSKRPVADVRRGPSSLPSTPKERKVDSGRPSRLAGVLETLRSWARRSRQGGKRLADSAPLTVLLLSSLHVTDRGKEGFVLEERLRLLVEDVARARASSGLRPFDLVVVAGDITARGKPGEMHHARGLLRHLVRRLASGGKAPALILVPGNHDIDRDLPSWRSMTTKGAELDEVMGQRHNLGFAKKVGHGYRELVEGLHEDGVVPSAPQMEPYTLLGIELEHGGHCLALRGLDSAVAQPWTGKRKGVLGSTQIADAVAGLDEADLRVAVVHHVPAMMDPEEWRVLERAFDLVLTGSGHESDERVQVSAGGTIVVESPPLVGGARSGYAVLELGPALRVCIRDLDGREPVERELPWRAG